MPKEIKLLQEYFSKEPEVIAAFLFGSRAKKLSGKISDWDIAIYFKPEGSPVEWEEERIYPEEERIWDNLIDLLKTDDIDLVILNRVPANIAAGAISQGIPIIIKDRGILTDFMLVVKRQAEDYREFVNRYYEISQRASSLSPEDKERLKKTVNFLEEELTLHNYFSSFSFKDYNDIHKRHEVERWVENMVNASIDIGEIILAGEKKKIPDYYRDIFIQLELLDEFKNIKLEKFAQWVRLRNVLAHEYLDIKWKRIESFIKESEGNFREFIKRVKRFL
jgi:uncharacterized protein YutE (UPF0331/DUF86 family)/predicted nucleotidyltransferase